MPREKINPKKKKFIVGDWKYVQQFKETPSFVLGHYHVGFN